MSIRKSDAFPGQDATQPWGTRTLARRGSQQAPRARGWHFQRLLPPPRGTPPKSGGAGGAGVIPLGSGYPVLPGDASHPAPLREFPISSQADTRGLKQKGRRRDNHPCDISHRSLSLSGNLSTQGKPSPAPDLFLLRKQAQPRHSSPRSHPTPS